MSRIQRLHQRALLGMLHIETALRTSIRARRIVLFATVYVLLPVMLLALGIEWPVVMCVSYGLACVGASIASIPRGDWLLYASLFLIPLCYFAVMGVTTHLSVAEVVGLWGFGVYCMARAVLTPDAPSAEEHPAQEEKKITLH